MRKSLESLVAALSRYALPEGGFCTQTGGPHRPDATAWAILALRAAGARKDLIRSAQSRLAADQMDDGRVSIQPDCPEAFWPTPLAVIAWHHCPVYRQAQARAVEFLLATTGYHFRNKNSFALGHDTSIKGWPWIERTHSWVEPTSLVLLALELTGHAAEPRAQEARRMLLNRQLSQGGWNYGNTSAFGQQLRPMALPTGSALSALAGRVSRRNVDKSLSYLTDKIAHLRTPFSLGWSALGLSAWAQRPAHTERSLFECLARQKTYGTYNTQELSLLLVSLLAKQGLLNLLS